MKSIIKTMTLAIVMTIPTVLFAKERHVTFNELPVKAQSFVKSHFDKANVVSVVEDTEYFLLTEYKVLFNDGTVLEFNKEGEWEEIDMVKGAVPTKVVPAAILKYVNKSFPNNTITEIKRSSKKYELELMNGLELEFNKKGEFIRIDD